MTKHDEKVELLRGGALVSTLTGAFGQSLKETRLTAMLGYLIALEPAPFLKLFGFPGQARRVSLETRHDLGRSDILVETTAGVGIIEAKIDASDPLKQSQRYPAKWIVLLTHLVPRNHKLGRVRYVRWRQLASLLEDLHQSRLSTMRMLSKDFLSYLELHHMTKRQASVEIYAREINEPVTLEVFLRGQLYGCNYEAGSRISEAQYFAPHFGTKIAHEHPGVGVGISYVSKIETVEHGATWGDLQNLLREQRGGTWINRHRDLFQQLRSKWSWNKSTHRTFLFLGKPRLVFNPPVRKENLQEGKGWLSKRFLSFDELFEAWTN